MQPTLQMQRDGSLLPTRWARHRPVDDVRVDVVQAKILERRRNIDLTFETYELFLSPSTR